MAKKRLRIYYLGQEKLGYEFLTYYTIAKFRTGGHPKHYH